MYIECVISLMRSYDKVFDSLFKDKITELCLNSLLCHFIIIRKVNKYFHLKVRKLF